tara:strand:+ start:59831 stop:60049 length:219 start_codon:yes stop_codon:yes gene_type:complete
MSNEISIVQCKMARIGVGLGVRELATLADVSPNTITRFERGERLQGRTVLAIKTALEEKGAIFLENDTVKID